MAFVIVGAYMVCWGPSMVYNMLYTLCTKTCFHASFKDSETEELLGFLTKLLTFLDGVFAPVVYCVLDARFEDYRRRVYSQFRRKMWNGALGHLWSPPPPEEETETSLRNGEGEGLSDCETSDVTRMNYCTTQYVTAL